MIKDRKEKYLRVRMTEEEINILKETAEENGISLSRYIRLILDQTILMLQMERKRLDGSD